jgi:hypothetical protein
LNHTVLHFLCGENAAVGSAAGRAVEYVSCEPTESARELFDEDCEPIEE